MPVNLSANKVQWGMIETLFLSLILNPAWLINQTKCSGCETERSSVKVTVIRCPSYRAGSRWAAVHVYLLHTAASCVCECVTASVYVIEDVCVSVPAFLSILMTGRMMNGTESVVFILGRVTQSGSHPGLQSQLLGQHWDTHHLTHAPNRRLHASCMHTDMKRRRSQYTVDLYTKLPHTVS